MSEGIHRDDLPMDVAEAVSKHLGELFPGMKVVFAGDAPGGPQGKVRDLMDSLDARMKESLRKGECMDCGTKLPVAWPPPKDEREEWSIPDDWSYYDNQGAGDDDPPGFFICPKCESETPQIDCDIKSPDET